MSRQGHPDCMIPTSHLKQSKTILLLGLAMLAVCFAAPGAAPFALLTSSNAWKYNDESMDLGSAWIATNYNDSAWSNGLPAFGFAGPGFTNEALPPPNFIRTLLRTRTPTNAARSIITFYFRTHFTFTNDPGDVTLMASNLIDDGAVFYLNGQELRRVAMPNGPVMFSTLATRIDDVGTRPNGGPTGHGFDVVSIPVSSLVQGDNVFAVEVHQGTLGSPDMVFQMELWANYPTPTLLTITNEPQDLLVEVSNVVALSVGISGDGGHYQWYRQSVGPVPGATSETLYIPSSTIADSGLYYLVVTNVVNAVTSRVARVSVGAPALVSAYANMDSITVTFSKSMDELSTTNVANYQVINSAGQSFAVSSAQLTNGTNAILSFTSLPPNVYYLIVDNVRDASATTNLIVPNIAVRVGFIAAVVAINATWTYEQDTNDLSTEGWTGRTYNDAAWTGSGPGLLDGKAGGRNPNSLQAPVGTVLIAPTNGPDGIYLNTTYFRTHFNSYAAGTATLTFRTVLDDGALLYLNGVEFNRIHMPAGPVIYATQANGDPIFDARFEGPFTVTVSNLLPTGNVIAVEVHQIPNSSDVTWGGEFSVSVPSVLVASVPTNSPLSCTSISVGQPRLRFQATNGTDLVLFWTNPATNTCGSNAVFTLQQALSLTNPASATAWSDVTTISPYTATQTNASQFFRLKL